MHRVAVILLVWVLAGVLAGQAAAQSPACAGDVVKQSGAAVDVARKALQAVPEDHAAETIVSPLAQGLIAALKDRLAEFMATYMACATTGIDVATIKRELEALSHAPDSERRAGAANKTPPEPWWYGGDLAFEARLLHDAVPLIGVTAKFAIECGNDALLAIYTRKDDRWVETLRHHSAPYDDVRGAFTAFDYAVSPPDESGRWYAVVKHIPAWCTSTWRSIRYSVLLPAEASVRPRIVFTGKDDIWFGNDDFGVLKLRVSEFELTFHSWSIDMGVHNRVWVRRFSIDGFRVQRIDPVALTPRDFVDEWIRAPWDSASAWSLGDRDGLGRLHRKLHDLHGFEYVSARACSDALDQMQIEIAHDKEQVTYYFRVSSHGDAHRLLAITLAAQPACDGPDLLESMATR